MQISLKSVLHRIQLQYRSYDALQELLEVEHCWWLELQEGE